MIQSFVRHNKEELNQLIMVKHHYTGIIRAQDRTRIGCGYQATEGSGNLNEETSNASCSASSFSACVRAAASSINDAFC